MILNCVKKAYQEMVKEGLTPLEFNFPSFSINHENFNSAGLSILEDKIRLGIDSDKYGLSHYEQTLNLPFKMNYHNLTIIEDKIEKGSASSQEQLGIGTIISKILPLKIQQDPEIQRMQVSHAITNKLCVDSMSLLVSNLSFYQGFKSANERNGKNDFVLHMAIESNVEENKFIGSLIMLKSFLPRAYKGVQRTIQSFAERTTDVNALTNIDLSNPAELSLAKKIVEENTLIRNMIIRIQHLEKNPTTEIVAEIAKIDKKMALESFPLAMREIEKSKHKSILVRNF